MKAQRSTPTLPTRGTAAFDPLVEKARLRDAIHHAALALGMADDEARRCGEANAVAFDSILVSLASVRLLLDGTEPDPIGPEWMLTAHVFDLAKTEPLRSAANCMLLLQISMASQIATGCAVGYDGDEGVHVLRATGPNASPQSLAAMIRRVAATVLKLRQMSQELDAVVANVTAEFAETAA